MTPFPKKVFQDEDYEKPLDKLGKYFVLSQESVSENHTIINLLLIIIAGMILTKQITENK
jgi:hypothetical protein